MAEFLSAAWVRDLDAAARAAGVHGAPLVILHEIRVADDLVHYHVVIDADGASVGEGPVAEPTVTFTQDRDTAVAIACGDLRAQHAVSIGRVRISGDALALSGRHDELAGLEAAFEPVRAATEY